MTIVGFPSLISYIHEDGEGGGFVSFLSNQHFLPFLSHFRKFFEYRGEFLNDFSFPMNEGFFFFFCLFSAENFSLHALYTIQNTFLYVNVRSVCDFSVWLHQFF